MIENRDHLDFWHLMTLKTVHLADRWCRQARLFLLNGLVPKIVPYFFFFGYSLDKSDNLILLSWLEVRIFMQESILRKSQRVIREIVGAESDEDYL